MSKKKGIIYRPDGPALEYSPWGCNLYRGCSHGCTYHGWQDIIRKGFSECFRVLMPGGFLIFKWNETDIRVSEILKLTPHYFTSFRAYLWQTG